MTGIPIQFPSERERVLRNLEMTKALTPTQRLQWMEDFNETLFKLGGGREKVLNSEARRLEREEWRRIMIDVIRHYSNGDTTNG